MRSPHHVHNNRSSLKVMAHGSSLCDGAAFNDIRSKAPPTYLLSVVVDLSHLAQLYGSPFSDLPATDLKKTSETPFPGRPFNCPFLADLRFARYNNCTVPSSRKQLRNFLQWPIQVDFIELPIFLRISKASSICILKER